MTASNGVHGPADRDAHLANRATLFTLTSLVAFLLALVTMPLTFQRTDGAAARVAASKPLALGVIAGARARTARAHLRAHRQEREASGARAAGQPTGT
jgi:hypothetical protein